MPTLELEATAFTRAQLLEPQRPQVALAGRSNVGKSSLVNALANRRKLAKISATPGKTRSVNYYRAKPGDFLVVDLPGYGYARSSKQDRASWGKLIEDYLADSPGLKALVLLLDCRLPPQKADLALAAYAQQSRIPILAVLTKADKCNQREQSARQKEWEAILGSRPLLTSSSTKLGIARLWDVLTELCVCSGQAGPNSGYQTCLPDDSQDM